MKTDFQNITILGGGLLGGSLALALGGLENPPTVSLWARKQETVEAARELGIAGATGDLGEAVRDADLIVLAVPVGSMAALLTAALEARLRDGCLITDVGSVKRVPHQQLGPLLIGRKIQFIGSHPMAGSERNGLAAVTANLFKNAACLLTNDDGAPAELTAALERFWKTIGCRTSWMSAAVHDELVARISHLPHLIAASAARVCLKDPAEGRFGGGGLRDKGIAIKAWAAQCQIQLAGLQAARITADRAPGQRRTVIAAATQSCEVGHITIHAALRTASASSTQRASLNARRRSPIS